MARRRARTPLPRPRTPRARKPQPRSSVEQLTAAAAHDLATFRATLELEAELVQGFVDRPDLDPELRRHLIRLVSTGRALSHIGAHFVEVLRSDPSRETDCPVPLGELMAQARTLFWERAARRRLSLRFEPAPRIVLMEHSELVRHLLLNLLDNAIKFSERGVVHVRATWDPSRGLRLWVRDEGGSSVVEGGGFGMGLALLRELLRQLGGTLVRDTTEAGTEVLATVPLRAEPEPAGAPGRLRGARVILACDDAEDRRQYVSLLRTAGAGWLTTPLGDGVARLAATSSPAAVMIVGTNSSRTGATLDKVRRLGLPVVLVSAARPPLRGATNVRWVRAGQSAQEQAVEALDELVLRVPAPS